MTLPWDVYGEPPPPEPEVVQPEPTPNLPQRQDPIAILVDALTQALAGATTRPAPEQEMTGRELIKADAKSRSKRTLIQGLIFDVIAAVVAATAVLAGADLFQKETWIAFGVLLTKSVVSAIISYVMRLKVTPTIKTEGEKFAVAPLPRPIPEKERNIP